MRLFIYRFKDGTFWWIDEENPQSNDALAYCREYKLMKHKLGPTTKIFARSELKPCLAISKTPGEEDVEE
jgi:hypothetical protein